MVRDFSTAIFKTSTYTQDNGTCVEVGRVPGFVAVRDTKHRACGHISFPVDAFRAFLQGVR
ncbi:hypothetical protein GCM10022243_52660 [Saccharothrix violaceirubra]|uniref:DUF397 domain-containing protein n=1 Tax=Saccharothrix violaceirubra TaxID=413306 RepID=A0A7W7SYK1_9PSEU|nr:DUF397 domain-containing protein [Saccharothrix violaceirubra]MBB4963328.1 hypothetical protein [Saccharothrix violaceirubra]